MNVNQLPILGAEIRGLDLSLDLTDSENKDIKDLLTENLVLIIKNQSLSPKDLVKISSSWGGAFEHPVFKGLEETPEVLQIENMGEQFHTNAHWHSDVTFEQKPPNVTLLYAIEVPEEGGNTLFSNQFLAYEELDAVIKSELDDLRAVHSNQSILELVGADVSAAKTVEHPIFRTHPDSGRKAIFLTQAFVQSIVGMDPDRSSSLLEDLYKHTYREKFIYEHKWTKGDLVIWDNRCVLHYAKHGYGDARRSMLRVTTNGEVPR